jgi:hypothetical protein
MKAYAPASVTGSALDSFKEFVQKPKDGGFKAVVK